MRFRTFEAMASGGEVAKYDSQTMDSLASHSEGNLQSTSTKQELSHSQPFNADEVVPNDGQNDVSKSKKSHGVHNRKSSSSLGSSGGSHGFLPGLLKKIGFGSQEFKATDIHAPESHLSGMPRSGSHEVKNDGDGEHKRHHHHRHGTRDKETFGSEDRDREHRDLFGSGDVEDQQNVGRANSLFGFEDTKFERGEKGRDLFGSDDPDSLSFREKMNIVGPVNADTDEIERTSNIFGDEKTEDSDDEVGSEDNLKRKKKVHNGHSVRD